MTEETKLKVPTVHLNGTSREALLEAYREAAHAVHEAGRVVARTAPNGRDYYVQGAGALATAQLEHDHRMVRLRTVATELEAIAYEIM